MTLELHVENVKPQLIYRFGPSAAQWCADLPAHITELSDRWHLKLGAPFEQGASSFALRCTASDGTPAVLKLSPDQTLMAAQVDMLQQMAPSGRVPRMFATDPTIAAALMEEVVPGTLADDLPDETLPALWADLLAALHGVPLPDKPLPHLRSRCEESFERVGRNLSDPAISARIDEATWNRAFARCQKLLDTQSTAVMLHGDLHPGNALDGGPSRGLMAIDPKLHVGDPCFDAFDYVLEAAGGEGIRTRCERVASACGLDGDRLLAWGQTMAPMFVIGHLRSDGSESAIEELLELAR